MKNSSKNHKLCHVPVANLFNLSKPSASSLLNQAKHSDIKLSGESNKNLWILENSLQNSKNFSRKVRKKSKLLAISD